MGSVAPLVSLLTRLLNILNIRTWPLLILCKVKWENCNGWKKTLLSVRPVMVAVIRVT